MRESIPQQIGRYEVITLLGEGGMARAYLAVSRGPGGFNKLVVVKQILPSLAGDANFAAMFLDEARLAARLHHPNIVQTFDVAEHEGNYLLSMEYLEGLPLTTIFKRVQPKNLPIETHLWVLTQVLAGLHYAHTLCDYDGTPLHVVHRDVSPANVLVTYTGDVKLLDFGVAKVRGALAEPTDRNIKGKPGYCAPEQLRAIEPDARADVFAVGVMLWECLAGRRYNRGRSLTEAAKVRLSGQEPNIREVCPGVDPALADICDRALAMDPEQRFATAAEFRIELRAQLSKLGRQGRSVLLERMEEVFGAERRELRKLIEVHLAGKRTPQISARATDGVMTSKQPCSPTPEIGLTPRSRFQWRLGMLVAVALLAAAFLGGLVARWARERPSEVHTAAKSPRAAPPQAEAESVPLPVPAASTASMVAPAPVPLPPPTPAPLPQTDSVAREQTQARPINHSNSARPTRVASKSGDARKARLARRSRPSAVSAAAARKVDIPAGPAIQPAVSSPNDLSAVSSSPAKRRPPPNDPLDSSGSAVLPGTHLVRPAARPVRGSIDEKDPYTP